MRLFSHPKYNAGGAERQMELIGRCLQKKNVDIIFIINRFSKNQKKFEIINGIKVYTIGKIKHDDFFRKKKTFFQMINNSDLSLFHRNFFRFSSDIYHLRCADVITGIWAFYAKLIKRKKFIFTAASIGDCIPNFFLWSKISNETYKFAIQHADRVVVLTDYMKKELDKNFGVKSIIIKSGHPIPKGPFKKEDPPIILWISSLAKLKRPELFLKIVKELKDLKVNFLLIGPREYMKKELIVFSKKQNNFSFIPGVPSGKDNFYYSKASLLVNTSIYEGFPNTFIQAWLRETPVITLDIDPDCIICKNNLGFHAKGNFNKLVNKVKELIENPQKLREMGKNCRKYALINHNIKKTAEQYYNLYKSVLQ